MRTPRTVDTLVVLACSASASWAQHETFLIEFDSPGGEAWTFRARIDRPDPAHDVGAAVMLFSGGLVADLDWTVQGSYEWDGQTHQMTIDGQTTRDGATLASALNEVGFTVLRYSSIRENDPLHAENPAMAQPMPFPATVGLACAAWDALLERSGFEPGRVIALGHSLGAARAVLASDGGALGYAFLAGAYTSPTAVRPSAESGAAMSMAGEPGADGFLDRAEYESFLASGELGGLLPDGGDGLPGFEHADADGSGAVSGWELAAAARLASGPVAPSRPMLDDANAIAWPSEILLERSDPGPVSVVASWGGLDTMSYHGPALDRLARGADGLRLRTLYYPDLGHQLSPVEGGLVGSIDQRVVDDLVLWMVGTAGE